MEKQFDVIIIGAGPGGIFCAYELLDKKKDLKVLLLEKGRSIEKRQCPKGLPISAWDVSPARLPPASRERELF